MNKNYFLELAQYNIWANQKMVNWLLQISDEQWSQKLIGSFESIEATVIHTAGSEKLWFERLTHQAQPFLPQTFKGNKNDLIEIWKDASENLRNYVLDVSDNDLKEFFEYKNLKGDDFSRAKYQAIAHVFNHSTYHRGQLVNYLRQVGFTDVDTTDLIYFY
jgi:uncharacterized damage-inducible protein DinB